MGRSQTYSTPSTFQSQRPPAPRQAVGAGVDALRHVEFRALVVIAHQCEDVGRRELGIRRHRKRIRLRARFAAVVVRREMLAGGRPPQNAPDAGIAYPPRQGRRGTIRIAKAERLSRLRIVPALAAGETLHVLRIAAIRRVVAGKLADAGLVGMTGNLAVGNPHRDPGRPLAPGAGSHHLQNPRLLGVGNGERFAFVAVAVLVHQAGYHLDGFARGAPRCSARFIMVKQSIRPRGLCNPSRPPKVVSLMASWCSFIRPSTLYV